MNEIEALHAEIAELKAKLALAERNVAALVALIEQGGLPEPAKVVNGA